MSAGGALQLAGTAIKVGGIQQQAGAQADAANYNAAIKEQNAQFSEQQAAEDERTYRVHSTQAIGNERANYGASGVSSASGSALDVLQQSAATAELDALRIRNNGAMKAWGYRAGANLDVAAAANAHVAGNYAVAGALLDGLKGGASGSGGPSGGTS